MKKIRNPVDLMRSVNALDMMEYSYRRLKTIQDHPARLAEILEEIHAHRWALRNHIDGSFDREDSSEENN